MKNKVLISVTLLLLLLGLSGYIRCYFWMKESLFYFFNYPIEHIALNLTIYLAIYQLIKAGTITKTIYWRLIYLSISITILGALFKIQHWAIANTILVFGLSSIAVIYIFRFLNKRTKSIFDWLKLVSVCSFFILKALIITHTIEEVYGYISAIILIITYLYFIFTKTTNLNSSTKNNTFINNFKN